MYSVTSTFIISPSRKMVRLAFDDAAGEGYVVSGKDVSGAVVRIDCTVWQDEAEKISKAEIEKHYLAAGALSVDIRITRLPRENIRADAVLKAETLRDKLVAAAELRGETVSESVLQKADALENMDAEKLIQEIGKGVGA